MGVFLYSDWLFRMSITRAFQVSGFLCYRPWAETVKTGAGIFLLSDQE